MPLCMERIAHMKLNWNFQRGGGEEGGGGAVLNVF